MSKCILSEPNTSMYHAAKTKQQLYKEQPLDLEMSLDICSNLQLRHIPCVSESMVDVWHDMINVQVPWGYDNSVYYTEYPPFLKDIQMHVEKKLRITANTFNSCLIQKYRRQDFLRYQKDASSTKFSATLCFGSTRNFKLRYGQQIYTFELKHGNVLAMFGDISEWECALLPGCDEIITLTFRKNV